MYSLLEMDYLSRQPYKILSSISIMSVFLKIKVIKELVLHIQIKKIIKDAQTFKIVRSSKNDKIFIYNIEIILLYFVK